VKPKRVVFDSLSELRLLAADRVEVNKSDIIVIDSINGYMSAMPDEGFLHAHLHERIWMHWRQL